ncbi:ift57, partial [Symbiodinium microadriaticum]
VKVKLEELENKSTGTNESVAKLTNELSEVSERLDELKESFESRDSGMNDTSPLVRIKAALQQIKAEVHEFDLRIGVMAHSVLAARVGSTNRRRQGAANSRRRRHKSKKGSGGGAHRDPSYMDSEGDMDEL